MFEYNADVKRIYDWVEIQRYHDEGHGFIECQNRFRFTRGAWIKAVKRGELRTGEHQLPDRRRRYDWGAVQAYYNEGHSYRECRAMFGFCAAAWTKAVDRGALQARARAAPLAVLLATSRSRKSVKHRLLQDGIMQNTCRECGLREWLGKPLSMHIDHINGVSTDHRLENLRMLCPNCHSQTPTYGGRNVKRRNRSLQDRGHGV